MIQEDKDLLLKDLCMRLPYGVKVFVSGEDFDNYQYPYLLTAISKFEHDSLCKVYSPVYTPFGSPNVENIKPYLRPMSSMTVEEFRYFMGLRGRNLSYYDIQQMMKKAFSMPNHIAVVTYLCNYLQNINWLLSNHFDVYGLIKKDLALEAPEDMYKSE